MLKAQQSAGDGKAVELQTSFKIREDGPISL
jgi:hypothetical protein